MIRWVTDPALTDRTTLVIYAWEHEWYFWRESWKLRCLYYRNGDYKSGPSRLP